MITSGGPGTVAPASVDVVPGFGLIQINFGRPVCPGESSFEIGMLSTSVRAGITPVWLLAAGPTPILQTTARVP